MIDGVELRDTPEVLAATGQIAPVEGVMLGTNLDEGRFMLAAEMALEGAPFPSRLQFHKWLETMWPGRADAIAANYPPASGIDPARYWKVAVKIYTDAEYFCPSMSSSHWLHKSGKVAKDRVFQYRLTYEPSYYVAIGRASYLLFFCKWLIPCNAMNLRFGAAHAADVPLVWAQEDLFNATDAALSKLVVTWWQQFAESFNPGQAGDVVWPRFYPGNNTLILDPAPTVVSRMEADICAFWEWIHPVPYAVMPTKQQQMQQVRK